MASVKGWSGVAGAVLAMAVAVSGAAAQEAMFRGDGARTGHYGDEGPAAGAVEAWRSETGGAVRSSPAVTATAVYVGSGDGGLYALARATGERLWRYEAGDPVTSSPAVAGHRVVVTTRAGAIHVVSMEGRALWTVPAPAGRALPWGREGWDYYASSPLIVGERVIVATPDGAVRALALEDGTEAWRYETGARIRSSPATASGVVVVGDDAGVVHGIDLEDGHGVWRHSTDGAGHDSEEWGFDRTSVQATPALADGRAYVGSRDGGLYALDLETGQRLWRVDYGFPWVIASAATGGGRVYVGSSDGHFVQAVEGETGEEVWKTEVGARVFASPALADGTLYVADHAGRVLALDPASGEVRWSLRLADQIQSSPVPAGDALFIGTDDGAVHALRAAPSPARLAVFWDSAMSDLAMTPGDRLLRDYLADHGYEVLDAGALAGWMEAGLAPDAGAPTTAAGVGSAGSGDAGRSVVVFAIDHVPAGLGGAADTDGLLRRYLEAGGKVVWLGLPPWSVVRDSTGRPTALDLQRHQDLGIDLADGLTGEYGATPTPEGRAWGLRGVRLSSAGIRPGPGLTALARDETGRIAAAALSYGGPEGTGLVALWGRGARWETLEQIRAVAEYGVVR